MAVLDIRLLGAFNIQDASGQTIDLRVKKVMALFAYLVVQNESQYLRKQLAQLFWPDTPDKHARQSLRQALADLRKNLPYFDKVFDISRNEINIHHANLSVDVKEFIESARIHDFASQEKAYQLYKGDFLEGFCSRPEAFTTWWEETRANLQERYVHVVEFLAEHNLLEGKTEKAISLNNKLIQLDPIRESAHRCLMSLYAKAGDQDKVEEQYQQCCKILNNRLHVAPEERTTLTYQRIKKQFNEEHEIAESDSTVKLASLTKPGREKELLKIASLLKAFDKHRQGHILFISGDSGIGKSWLLKECREVAQQLGFSTTYSRFFNIKYNHENGIRDSLIEIIDPDPSVSYNEIPEIIAERFFKSDPKHDINLAILYIIFDLPLAKRLQRIYSTLNPENRERLHTRVIVDILYRTATEDGNILIFDDIDYAMPRAMSILCRLSELTSSNPVFLIFACQNSQLCENLVGSKAVVTRLALLPIAIDDTKKLFSLESNKYTDDLTYLTWAERLEKRGCLDYNDNLVSVIRNVINQLEEPDKRALQACAVLGMRFSADALHSVIDNPHYEPENLTQAGFLVHNKHVLEFTHVITQQCIYNQIEKNKRNQLHSQAASYYLFGNSHLYAYHLEASASGGAARAYISAALSATEEFRLDFASYFFDKAYECAADNEDKYFSAMKKGEMLLGSERIANAIQSFEQAQHLAGDRQRQAHAWLGMAIGLIQRKQYLAAKGLLDRSESILAGITKTTNHEQVAPDHLMLARYYYYRALTMRESGSIDAALRYNKIAHEHAKQYQSTYWQANIAILQGKMDMERLHIKEAYSSLEIAKRISREGNHGYLELQTLLAFARVNLLQANFSDSIDMLENIMDLANLVEDHTIILEVLTVLCINDIYKGQYHHLLQHADLALDLCDRNNAPDFIHFMRSYRLLALYHLNRPQEMKAQMASIQSAFNQFQPEISKFVQSWNLTPIMALIEDNKDTAAEYLANTMKVLHHLTGPDKLQCCFIGIEAALKHGLWEDAENLADQIIMELQDEPLPFFIMCAERVRILSRIGHNQINHTTRAELVDILTTAKQYGLTIHLPAYENALEKLRHSSETI